MKKQSTLRPVTPLLIISLFLAIVEITLSITIINTEDAVQVILTIFTVIFTASIALAFFLVLWIKPHHFYSPIEYHETPSFEAFIAAFTRSGNSSEEKHKEDIQELDIANHIEYLISTIRPAYLRYLFDVANQPMSQEQHMQRLFHSLDWESDFDSIERMAYIGVWIGMLSILDGSIINRIPNRKTKEITVEISDNTLEIIAEILAKVKATHPEQD